MLSYWCAVLVGYIGVIIDCISKLFMMLVRTCYCRHGYELYDLLARCIDKMTQFSTIRYTMCIAYSASGRVCLVPHYCRE